MNAFIVLSDRSLLQIQYIDREMSSRRRSSSRISEDEINDLISKLQSLLPESRRPTNADADANANAARGSTASKLLKETCRYIRSLHREVDDLSDRLSDLMTTMDTNSAQADIIRSLLIPPPS